MGRLTSTKRKYKIWVRDNFVCSYCHRDMKEDYFNFKAGKSWGHELTVDHIIPRHAGGNSEQENLTTCCRDCNLIKEERERPILLAIH